MNLHLTLGPVSYTHLEATVASKSVEAATAPAPTSESGSVKCEEAEVNPVTGHAECIRPRGAAVDPPPRSAVPCSAHFAAGAKRGCPQSAPDSSRPH